MCRVEKDSKEMGFCLLHLSATGAFDRTEGDKGWVIRAMEDYLNAEAQYDGEIDGEIRQTHLKAVVTAES